MKKIHITIILILFTNTTNLLAEEKIYYEKKESLIFNEEKLKKIELLNPLLWAFLKDTQRIESVSNLNIKKLESIFNNEKQFSPIQESINTDLENMSLGGYYAIYTSTFNSAKYYFTVKSRMNNRYPVENDKDIQIKLIITPNSNQCITRTGIQVFNKKLNIIYSFPPQFKPVGNTEEEKAISMEKFISQNKKYYPKYYMNYHASDVQGIGFSFAQNDCLLSVTFAKI
jgi:hypothetical protein